jgi:plasmid replication initiation protein
VEKNLVEKNFNKVGISHGQLFELEATDFCENANSGEMKVSFAPSLSRDEMNLAEFPLTVLSSRNKSDVKTLEFKDSIKLKSGEMIEREWIITGADKFGLPTSTEDDVILGLICLTMEKGFTQRKIYFSRYELMRVLRWPPEGRNYTRLTRSLDRLSGVRIRASNAFFDNSSKAFQTKNFGIIDAYELNDERSTRAGNQERRSYFIWSETMFDSFQSGFVKKLDLELYFSLKSSVSRRLYRYLDKHFYYRSTIEKPLMTLAFEKLGLSRTYRYVSTLRQQIAPALEELQEIGFLSRVEFLGRGSQTVVRFTSGSGDESVIERYSPTVQNGLAVGLEKEEKIFQQPSNQSSHFQASQLSAQTRNFGNEKAAGQSTGKSAGIIELERALSDRGLNPSQVRMLLESKSSNECTRIESIISYYDTLMASKSSQLRNPLGFLYRAIENPFRIKLPGEQFSSIPNYSGSQIQSQNSTLRAESYKKNRVESIKTSEKPASPIVQREVSEGELERLRTIFTQKLSCLRGVLDPHRFREAVEGCVREELQKTSA